MTASNLQEIYSACQSNKSEELALVPSLFSPQVYYSGSGWGRLWKWFYIAVRFLTCKDLKTDRLFKIMQKTEEIFSKRLPLVVENARSYQDYLRKRITEEEVDEKEVHALRKSVRKWTRSTAPFTSFLDKGKNKNITFLFQIFYSDALEQGLRPFSYGEEEKLLQETQLFIDLEGYLHRPLPIPLLKKLACGIELTPEEKHELENWVEILNKKKHSIPVGLFLDCLKALTENSLFGGNLTDLQVRLLQNDLELLLMEDREHLRWRASLRPGDELACDGHLYKLGESVGLSGKEEDKNILFKIDGDEDHVIAIGMNQAYWPVKQRVAEEFQWGVKMPDIRKISPDGRFAVIEKLSPAVLENQWKTPKNHSVIDEDLFILTPIVNLLQWWGKQLICPVDFSLDYLMFNNEGELKYTHSLQPQPFDFRQLEDLAQDISQGHLNIYLYIMEQSNLSTHITMNFYRRVVQASLNNENCRIKNLAAQRKTIDPEVIRRGRHLYKEIRKMRTNIVKTLNREFNIVDQEKLLSEVSRELFTWYTETCSASRIWPTIEASVTGNLRNVLQVRQRAMTTGFSVTSI